MTEVFPIHLGDTLTVLSAILKFPNITGVLTPSDLTNAVSGDIKFKMFNRATGKNTIPLTSTGVTFTTDDTGNVEFDFSVGSVAKAGIYYGYFVQSDNGETKTYPYRTGDLIIEISSDTQSAQDAYMEAVNAGYKTTIESEILGKFPDTLVIGDSYSVDTGQIKITITDGNGDPITSLGTLDFADAEITFTAFRPGDSATIVGTVTFVDATTETYVLITIPSLQTMNGKAEYTYEGRLKFFWEGVISSSETDADDEQKTYKTTPFKFIANT